ncbi:MFS general substrate transporter [Roridomyces roridus]|uniref:MFS general substrate transporter n=1 Tax=Roridomyces roridus TaxID=1738132 RepID=A0AAD7BNB8_9AGAR|nr:MFS general substrate transporter [Roridomyces roridus]
MFQGGIGTAAPTIVEDLHGGDFTWVSSAYTLSSAACIPISGNLAQIFGRRPILLVGVFLFAAGSAISGSAQTMTILIVGRGVQGAGGGAIQALTNIVVSDLVSLRQRGLFNGITGVIWSLGGLIAPLIAGSLAEKASWRWLFYINIPLCGVTFAVVFLFLRLPTPQESLWKKLALVDWVGNGLLMTSATLFMLALTWGGVRFPWSSAFVITPLVVGTVGFALALYYEFRWAAQPTVGIVTLGIGFYLPTWFQSVRDASPITSGIYLLPLVLTISPSAVVQGILVAKTGKYRLINCTAWCILLVGVGLLVSVEQDTSIGLLVLYQLIMGTGMGLLYSNTFVVLAPLDVSDNAAAVALLAFLRIFSQAWGVSIGGAILQNTLQSQLPDQVTGTLPSSGTAIAYAIIPLLSSLPQGLKAQVESIFVQSFRQVWTTLVVLAGVGLCTFVLIKDIPLRTTTDKKWDVDEKRLKQSESTTVTEVEDV